MASEAASIVLLPCVLVICALFDLGTSAVLIFCAAIFSLAMFFASWETSKPALRQIMPVVVLSALASAGRIIFAVIPSVQPLTAICVIAGAAFGRREGFMTGALAAFVSNCFLGQGMWTPWQMYAWGLVGYLAGILFSHIETSRTCLVNKTKQVSVSIFMIIVCAFGFFASYLFSFIMNTWVILGFMRGFGEVSAIAIYASGFVFDTAHAVSTVVFLLALYPSWQRKLSRIKIKYAMSA